MNAVLALLAFAFIMIMASGIIRAMGADAQIYPYSLAYLRITAFSLPFMAAVMVYAGSLRGAGDTRAVLWITLIGIWAGESVLWSIQEGKVENGKDLAVNCTFFRLWI